MLNLSPEFMLLDFEVRKGIPGLKQTGIIENQRLSKHLATAGYIQSEFTPSLWKYNFFYLQWVIVLPFITSLGMVPVKEF